MRKLLLLSLFAATGCTTDWPRGGTPMILVNASGQSIGTIRAWQTAGGVAFAINASGLPHGVHGIHVHSVGRCAPPDFASAGAHWNPGNRQHGMNNANGPHAGDLPNVAVSANGVLHQTLVLPNASLAQLLDADGASILIHAEPDDYVSQPSGNSGARIACAVVLAGAEMR